MQRSLVQMHPSKTESPTIKAIRINSEDTLQSEDRKLQGCLESPGLIASLKLTLSDCDRKDCMI